MASIVGPSGDVDDLAQAALERLVRAAGCFEGRADFATYTFRTCLNVARNHRRWFRRWGHAREALEAEPRAADTDVLQELVAAERRKRVRDALETMRPERRAVLLLSDVEELPASRIAEIVGCPEPTVRSRLRAARADLAKALGRDAFFERPEQRRRAALLLTLAVLLVAAIAAAHAYLTGRVGSSEFGTSLTQSSRRVAWLSREPKHVVFPTKAVVAVEATPPAIASASALPPHAVNLRPMDLRHEFRIAEDELARGQRDAGRARLARVVGGSDLALAGDAVFLLARHSPDPAGRASLLEEYIARDPPSPYREQAMVERAEALLRAGDRSSAASIVRALQRKPIAPITRPALERLAQDLAL
jgi:RNA polymerase sigma-70 factor (ECF subfamily)